MWATRVSVICNKTFYKVYTLFSHTHLTTLSQLLAVGGVPNFICNFSIVIVIECKSQLRTNLYVNGDSRDGKTFCYLEFDAD